MSDEKKKDFVVKDRRIFSEGSKADEAPDQKTSADEEAEATAAAGETQATEKAARAEAPESGPPLPEINFSTFVVSLNASALMNLGAIEDPSTGQTNKNLPMAKQTIDILSMLEEKTAGNLTTEERNLLKNILYDLRIIYVKESG
jgi:hypothetical protein